MAQAPLVEGQITDGQKLLERLTEEGVSVTAAAWVMECDSDRWYLYIVTPLVGVNGVTGPAYSRIGEVRRAMPPSLWIGPFQIKVVGPTEPAAKALATIQQRHLGGRPGWYAGGNIGTSDIESVFIYPPLVPATRE